MPEILQPLPASTAGIVVAASGVVAVPPERRRQVRRDATASGKASESTMVPAETTRGTLRNIIV